jgi:large subunit ribosomal protein L13
MKTKVTKKSDIKRSWHLVDADDQILGRMATKIAQLLIGKNKPYIVGYLDCGDYVVVTNAAKVKITGDKNIQKLYSHHSGHPGGFKQISFKDQMAKDPTKVIIHAVSGMLPKNKLRADRLARLKIFVDEKHPYADKIKTQN